MSNQARRSQTNVFVEHTQSVQFQLINHYCQGRIDQLRKTADTVKTSQLKHLQGGIDELKKLQKMLNPREPYIDHDGGFN